MTTTPAPAEPDTSRPPRGRGDLAAVVVAALVFLVGLAVIARAEKHTSPSAATTAAAVTPTAPAPTTTVATTTVATTTAPKPKPPPVRLTPARSATFAPARRATGAAATRERAYFAKRSRPTLAQAPSLAGAPLDVTFSHGLPGNWTVLKGVQYRPGARGLEVTTSGTVNSYELLSSQVTVGAGEHVALAQVAIVAGGLQLGVLDMSRGGCCWLGNTYNWYGDPGLDRRWAAVRFTVDKPTKVRLVLANWALGPAPSGWILRRAAISAAG